MRRPPFVTIVVVIALGLALAGAALRASSRKFLEQRSELQKQFAAERQRLGLDGSAQRARLYAEYPSPELTLCQGITLQPGESGQVAIKGRFAADTVFMLDSDDVTLTTPVTGKGSFKAGASAAPAAGPGFAKLHGFTPVSGAHVECVAVFVGGPQAFELAGSNGWTLKLVPSAKTFAVKDNAATVDYTAEFYKPGESKPFERLTGHYRIDPISNTREFSLSFRAPAPASMAQLQALQQKYFTDPQVFTSLSDEERERVQEQIQTLTQAAMAEQMTAIKDPAAMQKKQDDFGCQSVNLTLTPEAVTGVMRCGKNVGPVKLTGKRS